MKEEIKIGEYVRTKKGIRKIIEIDEDNNYYIDKIYINDFGQKIDCIIDSCILKHSPNITDLIEPGDYVNGKKVVELDFENETILVLPVYTSDELFNAIEHYVRLEQFKIKTIVTHEQFKSVSYEV